MQNVRVTKASNALQGELFFPGDKSLSHRAVIFGSLAEGESTFKNLLPGEDCVCTREAFKAMGVSIVVHDPTHITIHGNGHRSLKKPTEPIWCGNSGTTMRLLMGVLSGCAFESTLTGDPSLTKRPMRRVADFLRQMGAHFEGAENANFAPIKVRGGNLKGIHATLPISSAQVKSAILLAGLFAEGETTVTEPVKSRDHSERFLHYFGASLEENGLSVTLKEDQSLKAKSFDIPGDISSAAFFMAMAALVPNSMVRFRSVLWNPTRIGVIECLKRMGVNVQVDAFHKDGPEVAADFSLKAESLKAFEIQKAELPALIDEIPILAVMATQAQGTTIIHEADELRVKETDRIESMVTNLSKMGADIRAEGNTIYIKGPTRLKGAEVRSYGDHRTAMSLIVAGLVADGETLVQETECINTSFPSFFDLLQKVGGSVRLC